MADGSKPEEVVHSSERRSDEWKFVVRLQNGDEAAFRDLVQRLQAPLKRLARSFSRDESVVDEAVQETWIAVIKGIRAFEGRAPLRSWVFSILVNHTRKLAVKARQQHRVELALGPHDPRDALGDDPEPGMGPKGRWRDPPVPWGLEDPESVFLSQETLGVIERALESMPDAQRRVLLLRDVEGLGSDEVCNILGVSGTNERVLLHRGRARVRRALDDYLRGGVHESSRRRRTPTR